MQPNIFLTGATGYIGGAIADALIASGRVVIGLARSDEARTKLQSKGVFPIAGDLTAPAVLAQAVAASDGVIHAGTTNNGAIDEEAIRAIQGALAGSGKPFIYTSGIWVIGDTGGKVADETWPVNPAALVAWRPRVEELVLQAAAQGIRTVVIRPGVVYGRGGGILRDFVNSARETGAARYVGTGENRWPVVHVEDLADLYVRALNCPPATLLFAADATSFRVREIAEAASRGAGRDGRTEAWPLEDARRTLGAYADALVLDQLISSDKARTTLGWRPRSPSVLDDLRAGSYTK